MDMRESVGVGACAPVAKGRVVKSSEPLGLGEGRTVRMDEREGGVAAPSEGPRITVVLYSDISEAVFSNGCALPPT